MPIIYHIGVVFSLELLLLDCCHFLFCGEIEENLLTFSSQIRSTVLELSVSSVWICVDIDQESDLELSAL